MAGGSNMSTSRVCIVVVVDAILDLEPPFFFFPLLPLLPLLLPFRFPDFGFFFVTLGCKVETKLLLLLTTKKHGLKSKHNHNVKLKENAAGS